MDKMTRTSWIKRSSDGLKEAKLLVCICLIATSVPSYSHNDYLDQLPDLGSAASNYLSDYDAARLGKAFIRQSRYQLPYIYDPELVAYVNDIGNELLTYSEDADKPYRFYLIDDDSINAFAVPGGHIALHKAILTKSESESELASVVAHEIAHVTQKHVARKIEGSRYDSILALGALLAAAAAGGGEAAQAAIGLSQASIIDRQLNYSRAYEAEADALGLRLMNKAGFDPEGMAKFFQRLLAANRLNESSALEFLRSHPLTINRVTEAAERAASLPAPAPRNEDRFRLMQAKATALYADKPDVIRDVYRSKIEQGDTSLATRYGYAVALSNANEFDSARKAFTSLDQDFPETVTIELSLADNELESGNIEQGLALLEALFKRERSQGNYLVDIYFANALVLTNRNKEAIPILRSAIANSPDEPYFHILLSRAYGLTGETMRSYQSRAEYHYLQGNYEFALRQIKHAFDLAKSDYERARLGARADDIERELEEIKRAR